MSEPWPHGLVSLEMKAEGGTVTYRLRASNGNSWDDPPALSDDAPLMYVERCWKMKERNPDMSDDQVHHRVLLCWWEEAGGSLHG